MTRTAAVQFLLAVLCACGRPAGVAMAGDARPGDSLVTVVLPEPVRRGAVSVEQALQDRRSVRSFSPESLGLADVGQLCWAAYGVNRPLPGTQDFLRGGLKTAPSAGALYPLELYVFTGRVAGIEPGVWRYRTETHDLVRIRDGDRRSELAAAALGQRFIAEAPASLVWSAIYRRTTGKYGDRGRERYVPMDAGHSAQNVYLQCAALGLGTVAVAAFTDDRVGLAAGLAPEEEPLYIMPVGRPAR